MPGLTRSLASATTLLTVAYAATASKPPSTTPHVDPCAVIAPKVPFVPPKEALACLRSFPFNETLRKNVLDNANGVLNFYTFEPYYLHSPPPFQESTINIRAELKRMATQHYASDYDFSVDLYNTTGLLNDGHTRWFPSCYLTFQSLLPAPITSLLVNGKEDVYVVPDLNDFLPGLPAGYAQYLAGIGFNYTSLAGAKVVQINGIPAYDYVDQVAHSVSSNYLDHGVRVNSVYSSYRVVADSWSQRFGDLAGPGLPTLEGLTYTLIPKGSNKQQKVFVPYVANYLGDTFTDSASFWAANCAVKDTTNGVDLTASSKTSRVEPKRPRPMGNIKDATRGNDVGLPGPYQPTAPSAGAGNSLKFFILPNSTTGVIFIGDFEPGDYDGFQSLAIDGINAFVQANVTSLIIDVHNNGGGYICLGEFLYNVIVGTKISYPGFQSTNRANPLAQKIVAKTISADIDWLNYSPASFAFLNDTIYPDTYNYMKPPTTTNVNGVQLQNSQRFHDTCVQYGYDPLPLPADPPIPLANIVVVGNGNCASTCSLFTTLLRERHGVKMVVFGGKPGTQIEYKGMAGNQVLEWADIDTEVKSTQLKNDPLAPPDLLIDGDFRINWRTAWSYLDESKPIAYESEPAVRIPYTLDTYNNPQNLWTFVKQTILKK